MAQKLDRHAVFGAGRQSAGDMIDQIKADRMEENRRMIEVRRMLSEDSLDLSDLGLGGGRRMLTEDGGDYGPSDLSSLLPEEQMAVLEARRNRQLTERMPVQRRPQSQMLFEDDVPQRAAPQRPTQKARPQMLVEDDEPAPRQQRSEPSWTAVKYTADTKGGSSIPVWRVENPKTGFAQQKHFRIEEVALNIANILNESNNANDPRVVRIVSDYEKRDRLLREVRELERTSAGKPIKTERVKQLKSEIAQINYRLGI